MDNQEEQAAVKTSHHSTWADVAMYVANELFSVAGIVLAMFLGVIWMGGVVITMHGTQYAWYDVLHAVCNPFYDFYLMIEKLFIYLNIV